MFSGSTDRFQVSLLLYWSDINVLPSRTNIFRENRWRRANSRRRNSRLLQVVYTRRDNNQSNQHQDTRQVTKYCSTVTKYIYNICSAEFKQLYRQKLRKKFDYFIVEWKERKTKILTDLRRHNDHSLPLRKPWGTSENVFFWWSIF